MLIAILCINILILVILISNLFKQNYIEHIDLQKKQKINKHSINTKPTVSVIQFISQKQKKRQEQKELLEQFEKKHLDNNDITTIIDKMLKIKR